MAYADIVSDENVRKLIDEWHVPGLGVAIIQGDHIHAKVCIACQVTSEIN